MVKRLWMALSALWTLALAALFALSGFDNPKWLQAFILEAGLPWLAGWLMMMLWRITVYRALRARRYYYGAIRSRPYR
jgi:hypothetical protein